MTSPAHDFWFSDVRYQFPPTTPAYRGTPVDYCLPSSTPAFLAAKRLINELIRVSTDVADKHARYLSEIAT